MKADCIVPDWQRWLRTRLNQTTPEAGLFRTALLLLPLLAVSCIGDDLNRTPPSAVEVDSRDSMGVRVVESSAGALEAPLTWVMDSLPTLELGGINTGGAFEFNNIAGITALPDGEIVVLDGGSGELRWFEPSGRHRLTFGGRGEGPAEFLDPLLVPQFHPDSILIFDRARRGFVRVAIDGSGARRLERPGGPGKQLVGTPRASTGSRAFFFSALGLASCRVNEPCEVPGLLQSVGLDEPGSDTIAAYAQRMLKYSGENGPLFVLHGPLDQTGLVAATSDGFVIEGGPRFEFKQFDSSGDLEAVFRVSPPSTGPDPEEEIGRLAQRSSDPREMNRIFDLMELPDQLPAFQALQVDELGWYWAEIFDTDEGGPSVWLVFEPSGRAHGVITLPAGLKVWVIGEDYVLGHWTDDLGVEYVRRYGLDRQG